MGTSSSGGFRSSWAPNSSRGAYIAKMKYEHEARLSTPGQQVGKRAGLGYGGLENRPLGKEPASCPG